MILKGPLDKLQQSAVMDKCPIVREHHASADVIE